MTLASQARGRRTLPVIEGRAAGRRPARDAGDGVDVRALQRDLARALEGEVRFDRGSRGLYATDASNFRQVPIGVVVPKSVEDVVAAHRICSQYGAPIVSRGAGTSLSGETVNFAVVIDHSKFLTRIGDPDVARRLVTVQMGAVNQKVNEKAGRVGLVFGPDPSTHAYCTIGGNVGNNSCGVHSVQAQHYGSGPRTSDNVHSLEVLTYDGARFRVGIGEEADLERIIRQGGRKGEIYARLRDLRDRYADRIRARFRSVNELPRRVSGYNLDELLPERGFNVARALVGTEGTCVTALDATLMLTPAMLHRVTVVVGYDDMGHAGDGIAELMEWKPIGLEGIDRELLTGQVIEQMQRQGVHLLPRAGGDAWLLIQFGADQIEEAREISQRFRRWIVEEKGFDPGRVVVHEGAEHGGHAEALWRIREGGLGATAFPPSGEDHWPGWEDSAVAPKDVGAYVRDLKRLYAKFGLKGAIYGHLGQGCIHSRISFDLRSAQGIRRYRQFLDAASDLVCSYGGSLSGEHGDGQQRAEFLHKQYGHELVAAMREFKRIWDPRGKMNPGKVVDPYRVDENLRLGASYDPPRPAVKFAYADDHGDFAHATVRCVGVGKCRQLDAPGVMCPSYMVTREEKHATRGRARLLFEMLQGEVVKDGWQSKEVYEALDLCLACKGCTSECPVQVDMPSYKAEFLYHHYQGLRRRRRRHMYAFGFIDQVARLAALAPELANLVTQTPGLSRIAKLIAGMAPERSIPAFAPWTLQAWFRGRGGSKHRNGPRVVLWPDTFNNHFHPQVGVAAVEALEAAGYHVIVPDQHVCCGRPLYDYGFLGVAERYLRRTLAALAPEIRRGTPLVGLEPSCVAVFRDELQKLLPHDEDARRLAANTYHFADFLEKDAVDVPELEAEAVVWGHCHHKATGELAAELKVFERMGLQVREAAGGCCGLAGSFGFEQGKHQISMQCAEVGFLPAIRGADPRALIVADGFSCRTQLEQSGLHRGALHTAEVLKLARESALFGVYGGRPERLAAKPPEPPRGVAVARRVAAAVGAGAALGVLVLSAAKALRSSG